MYMNIAALLMLLGLTWVWMNRGFFNALVHMLCTIAAGAIAFAVWEPLAMLLIALSPEKGMGAVLEYVAWGAALLLPFGISLLALRTACDSLIKTNIKAIAAAEYAGGGICGLVSGAITVGILVIAIGYLPLGTGFMGYRPIAYSKSGQGSGSLQRTGGLWIPLERLTASLYGQLSRTTLSTGSPLADWYPDLDLAGYAINTSAAGGMARSGIKPEAFRLVKTYTVGDPNGSGRIAELLVESDGPDALVQPYLALDGQPVPAGSLFGVVVEFNDKAKESNGQVVIGNGQARLIMQNADGEPIAAHPVALISQARSSDATLYGRWKFDGDEVFIASVGGAASASMAFEFVVPAGYTPKAFAIKNTRVLIDEPTPTPYATPSARFAAIAGGSLIGGVTVTNLDTTEAERFTPSTEFQHQDTSPIVPGNGLGFSFEVRQKGSAELDEKNRIVRGGSRFRPSDVNNRGIDRNVIVDRFAAASDVVIVRVNVSPGSAASMLGRAARSVDRVLPPQLIDTNGTAYPAVGWIYQDNSIIEFSYDPAKPIRGMAEIPYTISSSRTDQTLTLVFRVSKGVSLDYYAIGGKVIVDLNPPLLLDVVQN
jgi:hypothetical protein